MRHAADNPFAVEFVHGLTFRWTEITCNELLCRLQAQQGRGAIVGHEGSGKTTLLSDFARTLTHSGWQVLSGRCFHGRIPPVILRHAPLRSEHAVVLDGAKLLQGRTWQQFVDITSKAGVVLIAQHRAGRWPTVYETSTSVALLNELFSELVEAVDEQVRYWNERLWRKYGGNLRLVFREWYELWAEGHPVAAPLQKKKRPPVSGAAG